MIELFTKWLTLWAVIPLILFTGMTLSIRLRFIQVRELFASFRHLIPSGDDGEGSISNFQAVSAVLAGNLGTGNISGMAMALTVGGPGSLFWMWIMGFFGMTLKYAGCFLGVKYRHVNEEGEYVGGPMYYLREGLGSSFLATLFCIFSIGAAFTVGNLVQINSIVLPLEANGTTSFLIGIAIALAVGFILVGGLKRIANVVEMVVPLMTLVYLVSALMILYFYSDRVMDAFGLIFSGAFTPWSIGGAAFGQVLATGFERGVFATDAGIGIAPVLQSGAKTKNAHSEGLVGMVPPIIVLVICTITTLVLIVTDVWQTDGLKSTLMCSYAFQVGLGFVAAKWLVIVSIFLFGITTILAWAFCAEKAIEYLFGVRYIAVFNFFFILLIPIGTVLSVEMTWALADLFVASMLVCNLIAVAGLISDLK